MSADIDLAAARHDLLSTPSSPAFDPAELDGLPEPAARYLNAAITPGTVVSHAATLNMRGHIKIGRWLPFRAQEVLAPRRGFVWRARAAAVISGYDAYIHGRGSMRWKLLGLATVMRADGTDVSTSAAGRCGGEALWLPTALLPRSGVRWSAVADDHIVANVQVDTTGLELHLHIDDCGRPTSVAFERWGDPDQTGTFGWHTFGGDITDHQTFNGVTVPSAGAWGWHHGTDRWEVGEFFRCRITDLHASGP